MKLFKKTAALLFCLALVFSVMAISASAADGGYSVELTPTNANIKDQDSDGKYEIATGDTENVAYNIVLKNNTANSQAINAFRFKLTGVPTGLTPTVAYSSGNTQISGGWYVFDPEEGGSEDITMSTTSVVIGTITFNVTDDLTEGSAEGTALSFTVDDIQLSERATTDTAAVNYDLEDVSVTDLEAVSSTYTITLKTQKSDTNGTITDGDDATVEYSFLTGATLTAAANVWGYDFHNWTVANQNYGYAATYADAATVAARNIGNVELQSNYDLVTYTITYNYKETVTAPEASLATEYDYTSKVTNTTNIKTAYTIEDLASNATSDFLNLADMTRKGYTLTGWTATAGTGNVLVPNAVTTSRALKSGEYSTDIWNALDGDDTDSTTSLVGAYGNVVITPHWAIIGKQARDTYAFAYSTENSGDELVLFAVPTAQVAGKYYCRFDGSDYEMFTVVASGATTASTFKYKDSFVTTRDDNATGNDTLDAGETYTVFASIIPTSASVTPTFIVNESATSTPITYTGSIFSEADTPTAADYGNVNTMLGSSATLNTAVSIKQRLEANRDDTDGVGGGYGSILDVRAIITQMA